MPTSFPPKIKIIIASAHIHIPRNNPGNFHKSLMNSLRRDADNGSL